jgi:hypothetical protein
VILIAIPVLGRPERARIVHASATEATTVEHRVLFLCSLFDQTEIRACLRTGADVEVYPEAAGPGDWAKKLNWAIGMSDEPYILLGADDLRFHDGWAEAALREGAGVIGTNDLHNPRVLRGQHSTHPLVRREYAELGAIDGGPLLHEGYDHQYVDDEVVATAKHRGEWAFAAEAKVEHLHPYFQGAPMDKTYQKGMARIAADRALFQRRRRLLR